MTLTGAIVRNYRETNGVTLLEVAYALGAPPLAIEEMEKGNPDYAKLLLPAHNAIQGLARMMHQAQPERAWTEIVATHGAAG